MASTEFATFNQSDDRPGDSYSFQNNQPNDIDKDVFLAQISKILRSEEFRGSDVLRRLLHFLAEKLISGQCDDLKEYSIAIEALGKPISYDPRHNSAARILVSRLRVKLASYYQKEGQNDSILIELPKGRFRLTCVVRELPIEAPTILSSEQESTAGPTQNVRFPNLRSLAVVLKPVTWLVAGALMATAIVTVVNRKELAAARASSISSPAGWDASVEELWRPFVASGRPLIVAVDSPRFVLLDAKQELYYVPKNLNFWTPVSPTSNHQKLQNLIKDNENAPVRSFTPYAELEATFLISKILGSRIQSLSVVRTRDISAQQLTDNNIVFIGIQNDHFNRQIKVSPIDPPLEPALDGIHNLHPESQEPGLFIDRYTETPLEDGFAYALVSHLPGPMGSNDVEIMSSSARVGYAAAVKTFTDPGLARPLIVQLKQANNGQMPRYYQVLLKVQFKAGVPTDITYVLSRILKWPV